MEITRLNLTPTTEIQVGANKGQIEIDGAIFLNLTAGIATLKLWGPKNRAADPLVPCDSFFFNYSVFFQAKD